MSRDEKTEDATKVVFTNVVKTVMQDEGRGGITVAQAGIHVRQLGEKAPKRFSKGKPEANRPKVCLRKILRELFHKASHGSLLWHVFYLTLLRSASLFYILHSTRTRVCSW